MKTIICPTTRLISVSRVLARHATHNEYSTPHGSRVRSNGARRFRPPEKFLKRDEITDIMLIPILQFFENPFLAATPNINDSTCTIHVNYADSFVRISRLEQRVTATGVSRAVEQENASRLPILMVAH